MQFNNHNLIISKDNEEQMSFLIQMLFIVLLLPLVCKLHLLDELHATVKLMFVMPDTVHVLYF